MKTQRVLPFLFLAHVLLLAGNTFAQAGANDPSFNPEDLGYLPGTNGSVNAITVQPDGKIVIGGTFTVCNGITRGHIARMNADGSLDTGFDPGTGANNSVNTIAVQPDGKILVGGAFTYYNGLYHNHLARLNADGSQDLDFDQGIAANGTVNSIHVLSDGAILIAGAFSSYTGIARSRIARLNADGSLDESFDPGTGANNTVNSTQVLPDGNIVIAGTFTSYNTTARNRVARLDADGGLDLSFDPGSGANNTILSTAVQSDGKVLIGGTFTSFNGVSRTRIARLTAAGSLDTGFDTGSGVSDSLKCMYVQADGKVIIGGSFLTVAGFGHYGFARLNADGSSDTTFGIPAGGVVNCITAQADGDLLIGGSFDGFTFNGSEHHNMVRLHADGSEDSSFDLGTGACCSYFSSWSIISGMAVQPDGKILIGGIFGVYDGVLRHGIARLNEDGTLDTTFDPGTGVDTYVQCFDIQADGRILIGGDFTTYNGVARNRVARLNVDGSLDTTFAVGTGADGWVYSIKALDDGKVLIGGGFDTYNDIYRRSLARLNADGSLDSTFVPSFGLLTGILCTNVLPDGKILVGGQFHQCGDLQRNGLARLNTDGTVDADFDPGTGVNSGEVFSISVRSDGQILIAGDFTHYDGHSRHGLALFGPDGAFDSSVNPGSGTAGIGWYTIEAMLEQPDGKIIIAGHFTSYNGSPANSIARLEADGSLDPSFNSGAGTPYGNVLWQRCIALQNDWSLIFTGDFYSYDGAGRNCIARVLLDGTVGVDGSAPSDANTLHLWPNPTDGDHVSLTLDGLDRSLSTVDAELFDATGREVLETTLPVNGGSLNTSLDLGHAETGVYLLQLVAGEKTFSQRVVVGR